MDKRRKGVRHVISFPIRIAWKNDAGQELAEEGLTENVGPRGTLVYLPRVLPDVGTTVNLTVAENPDDEVTVPAVVLRLERNAAHPQAALEVTKQLKTWKEKVWLFAAEVLDAEEPEDIDDW